MAELITAGTPLTMVQNRVYALPARRNILLSSAAIEGSFSESSGFTALTNANVSPGIETALPFIRSTTAGTTISVKV